MPSDFRPVTQGQADEIAQRRLVSGASQDMVPVDVVAGAAAGPIVTSGGPAPSAGGGLEPTRTPLHVLVTSGSIVGSTSVSVSSGLAVEISGQAVVAKVSGETVVASVSGQVQYLAASGGPGITAGSGSLQSGAVRTQARGVDPFVQRVVAARFDRSRRGRGDGGEDGRDLLRCGLGRDRPENGLTHSGTFPCLRDGICSRLVRNMANDRLSTLRVSRGSITSST